MTDLMLLPFKLQKVSSSFGLEGATELRTEILSRWISVRLLRLKHVVQIYEKMCKTESTLQGRA